MNFNLFVAYICFLKLIYWVNCETETNENIAEAGKAVKIITRTSAVLNESADTAFFNEAKTLAKQFTNLFQDFNKMVTSDIDLVSSLTPTTTEGEAAKLKITEQFTVVYRKLQYLEEQINQVNILFKDNSLKSRLSGFRDMRQRLRDILDSFFKTPNNITVDQLKEICAANPMRDFINFLNSEIMNGGAASLIEAMKRGHNRKAFFQWTKNIFGMFVEATVLDNICFVATNLYLYGEEAIIPATNAQTNKFQRMLNKIINKLEWEHDEFLKLQNYMKWVKDDLREQMKQNIEMSHEEFSKHMTSFLADKYDWRSWIVGSYDGDTGTFDQHGHTLSDYSIQVFREDERCVFLLSMKNYENNAKKTKEVAQWGSRIRDYVLLQGPHNYYNNEKCKNVIDIIEAKYTGVNIVCVDSDKHMQFSGSPGALHTSFSVTTFKADGKTRTFPNQEACDKWVHLNYRGPYPGGLITIPKECDGMSMKIIVTNFFDL